MKRFLLSLVVAASFGVSTAAMAATPAAAKSYIDKVATQVIGVLKGDGEESAKQAKVEGIIADRVDIGFIGRFVLGKHWRSATTQQQNEYLAAYKPFILKNYAGKLSKYSGETYSIKNARADGDAAVVTMAIHDASGKDVIVDYRLRGPDSSMKIADIMVEGVSLLATQRSEFDSIVNRKGVDGLIEALKKH